MESFLYSESNTTIGSGALGSGTVGEPHLVILPGDSNGTNFLEVPISRKGSIQGFDIINGGTNYAPGEEVIIKGGNGYGLRQKLVPL